MISNLYVHKEGKAADVFGEITIITTCRRQQEKEKWEATSKCFQ